LALPVIGVGFLSEAVGLTEAGLIFCGMVAAAVAGVFVSLLEMQPQ